MDVVVAVEELEDVVVAVEELEDEEGGAVRGNRPGTEKFGRVELTAAAVYVAGMWVLSSSQKSTVGFFGPTHVVIGQLSCRAP